jgi:lysophospholipase L1-like esterase
MHVTTNTPMLYELNAGKYGISSQGLRDDEVAIPKPDGTLRILVLGDSVTFGPNVPKQGTYPNRLERLLQNQYGSVEVLNAGVTGYTAYNELQYYLSKGRAFEPDIVIVAFCMNDIVNPRRHWAGYTDKKLVDIPDRAIPNLEEDKAFWREKLGGATRTKADDVEEEKSLLERSALYSFVETRLPRLLQKEDPHAANAAASARRKRLEKEKRRRRAHPNVPTYVSAEQGVSIEVLLDRGSPEWQWLASIYDELHDAVKADNAIMMLAIFPLAYQLDDSYPFIPQKQFKAYCEENDLICVDFLPVFKQHKKADIFFLQRPKYYDVWHIKDYGHQVAAEELRRHLDEIIPLVNPMKPGD